jgi:hypothetical protein
MRSLLSLMIEFREHRDLDRTGLRKYLIGTDEECLPRVQIQDGNAKNTVELSILLGNGQPEVIPQR